MATRTIKTRLQIVGDQEYRDKLKKASTELTEQKSKLKQLTEEYKNNQNSQEALSKKVEQLKSVQEAQRKVVEAAKEGVKNAGLEQAKYANRVEEARGKIQEARKELADLNTSTEEGAARQAELNGEIKKYEEELAEAGRKQEAAAAGVADWEMKQSRAQTALNRTGAQLKEYERYLGEAEKSVSGCAGSIDQYGKKVKEASEKQEKFGREVEKSETGVDSLAAALAASGLSRTIEEIADALMECIGAAAEFETSLAKVSTIADTSAVDMDTIRREILSLSTDTGKSVSEISEAVYGAISASVDTAGAVEFVSQATKLAKGGFTDNAAAVDILTTVINAYGLELDKTSQISDYLITTQNLGKTTVNDLASSLGKVIPVAAAYHVEMDNLSSAMAVLTSNGIATAESTTYLKAMMNELGDSGSTVSKVLAERTGTSFSRLMEQGYSLGDVMEILGNAVQNDKGAFNELWSSSEAGIGALSLLSAGSSRYNDVLRQMRESAGATQKAYDKMTDTAEMAQKKLTNAFRNLKIAVGSELQDQMKGVYSIGTDLLEWAADFVEKNEWLIPVLEGVMLGIGALSTGMAGFAVVTKVLIPLWVEFTAVLSANPIGLVLTAITALVAILPVLASLMPDVTTEAEEQAAAWKEQAGALQECVDAYHEQTKETQEAVKDTRSLADSLKELIASEDRSEAEKEAIADITDRLNEKIPNLGLKYDALSDSINMTSEELDTLLDAMERQERYEDVKASYADIYAKNRDTREALAKAQEKLNAAMEEYNELVEKAKSYEPIDPTTINDAYTAMNDYAEAVEELEEAVSKSNGVLAVMDFEINKHTIETASMTEAERESIEAMMEAAEGKKTMLPLYFEEIGLIAQTAKEYDAYAQEVKTNSETVMQQIQELQEKYQESYQTAYENIQNQIGLFDEMKVESSKSIDDMIGSLGSQIEYMNQYAENLRLAMEYGVDEGILSQLADGSTESAAILQEIVNSGSEKIQELNEEFAKVSEGKDEFSNAIAELETYYGEELDKLVADTEKAVKEMARYDDAYKSALETCNGLMAGVDAQWGEVLEKYRLLAREAIKAYNEESEIHSPSRKFQWSAEMEMEGIITGVEKRRGDVLRKHEMMAKESIAAYQEGMEEAVNIGMQVGIAERKSAAAQGNFQQVSNNSSGASTAGSTTVQTYNIYTPVKSPSEIMRAARLEQQYGMAGE